VLEAPKVIRTSERDIQASLNQTVTLFCLFSASTLDGVTKIIWEKDGLTINSSAHYIITTRPSSYRPVLTSTVLTNLTIVNFTAEDKGVYSCQSYYNREKITSNSDVFSERVIFTVDKGALFDCMKHSSRCAFYFNVDGKKPFGHVIELCIAVGVVALVIAVVIIIPVVKYWKHLSYRFLRFAHLESKCNGI